MNKLGFCKFHGFGNDYIVVEKSGIPDGLDLAEFGRSICDRHTGVGSDGVALISKPDGDEADFFCEIVNPDGSIAGFSGNGTRCAVAFLFYKEKWRYPDLKLETRSGVKKFTLIERDTEGGFWFEAEIGKPRFASDDVPVVSDVRLATVIDLPIRLEDGVFLACGVNVGNPVACCFVGEFDFDWRKYAREMESHPIFPEKANIVFVKVLDRENIEVRIWERGAHETSASGTGASAAAVLSALTGRTERTVSVISPGGTTEVHWRGDDEILLTGRADLAFCGEWPL